VFRQGGKRRKGVIENEPNSFWDWPRNTTSFAEFTTIRRAASSVGNRLRIVESATEECILASVGKAAALLSPVQEGRIWRVRIVWANGAVHHFGKFTSEKEASRWIAAHPQLTKPVAEDEPVIIRRRVRSRKRRPLDLFSI